MDAGRMIFDQLTAGSLALARDVAALKPSEPSARVERMARYLCERNGGEPDAQIILRETFKAAPESRGGYTGETTNVMGPAWMRYVEKAEHMDGLISAYFGDE